MADRAPEKLLAGLREAGAILDRFFDELLTSRGLDNSCLALVGFSQGAATALYAGLRRQKRMAGVVAFSGALSGAAHLLGEIASKPPVLLVHGEEDKSPRSKRRASRSERWQGRALVMPSTARGSHWPEIFLSEVLASGRAAAGRPA